MQANFLTSAADAGGFPADRGGEVAVVGRSNSGKSSAINRLTDRTRLARVSKTPGRTQLINFFELAPGRRLVDLPGYGFARVPARVRDEWRGLIEAYFDRRRSLAGLFVTVDIRRGIGDLDRQMLEFAANIGFPVAILLTKSDKLSRGAGQGRVLAARREIGDEIGLIRFSAVDGTGTADARDRLWAWLDLKKAPGAGNGDAPGDRTGPGGVPGP